MKTSELTGAALDWAVAKIEGREFEAPESFLDYYDEGGMRYSTDWAFGGPIIEREVIQLTPDEYTGTWSAYMTNEGEPYDYTGPTPLIAAMRCFVASRLGDDVDVPKEVA